MTARLVDLISLMRAECLPQRPAVARENLAESLRAEVVEQRRRPLDVGEHERHGSRRLHCHR